MGRGMAWHGTAWHGARGTAWHGGMAHHDVLGDAQGLVRDAEAEAQHLAQQLLRHVRGADEGRGLAKQSEHEGRALA